MCTCALYKAFPVMLNAIVNNVAITLIKQSTMSMSNALASRSQYFNPAKLQIYYIISIESSLQQYLNTYMVLY